MEEGVMSVVNLDDCFSFSFSAFSILKIYSTEVLAEYRISTRILFVGWFFFCFAKLQEFSLDSFVL